MSFIRSIKTVKTPTYQSQLVQMPISELESHAVQIEVHYSSVNYKDALAITGRGAILKKYPLVPGIDASGVVLHSTDPSLTPGQEVLVTGCGLGETQNGGFAERISVPRDWVIPLPQSLTPRDAMILGTAGFTAALSLWRMLQMDQAPEMGPIAITGASGGVGSIAVQIFAKAGFQVVAISGKPEQHTTLKRWGAQKVQTPDQLELGLRPLESVAFGGAVDNVGGELLAKLLRHIQLWGNVACVGLADSSELNTTVMPFILRGVSLLGISSANCPLPDRQQIWQNLAHDWRPRFLQEVVSQEIHLKDVFKASEQILSRKSHGRILVKVKETAT
jgi:acrylyl-CoA reductase (NADPH)